MHPSLEQERPANLARATQLGQIWAASVRAEHWLGSCCCWPAGCTWSVEPAILQAQHQPRLAAHQEVHHIAWCAVVAACKQVRRIRAAR